MRDTAGDTPLADPSTLGVLQVGEEQARVLEEKRLLSRAIYQSSHGTVEQAQVVRKLTQEFDSLRLCDMDYVEI